MNEKLLQLPVEIQVMLAIGYLGYRVATSGLDKKHKPLDTFLQVMVYGAIGRGIMEGVQAIAVPYWWSASIGLVGAVVIAALWRRIGLKLVIRLLRITSVSYENFSPSTWDSIIQDTEAKWTYVSVRTVDGEYLESDLNLVPSGLPSGPVDTDGEGNIAIFVTHIDRAEDKKDDASESEETNEFGATGVVDERGRSHLTYIPASRIDRITVSRVTSSAGAAEVSFAASQD